MILDAAARRRYARQLLLGEVGEDGQRRLFDASFRVEAGSDEIAAAVATQYLHRAGCPHDPAGEALRVPDRERVLRLAGNPELYAAAASVAGAFAAVEHVVETLGLRARRELPDDLRLSHEG